MREKREGRTQKLAKIHWKKSPLVIREQGKSINQLKKERKERGGQTRPKDKDMSGDRVDPVI